MRLALPAGIILALAALTCPQAALAADGDPLAAFDTDGFQTIDFGNDDTGEGVVVQPDGKVVVAGAWDGGSANFAVARFNPDGSPDTSFSVDGRADVTFGAVDFGRAVALDGNGRIVVAGYTNAGGNNDMAVIRLNPDGSPDNSFSGDGKQTVDFGFDDRAEAVAIAADGSIFIGGTIDGGSADFAAAKLEPDGDLDPTFDADGMSSITFGAVDHAEAIALDAGGRVVLAGYSNASGTNDMAIARFNANGTPDNSFSTDALQTVAFNPGDDHRAEALLVQPDGRIVLAGFWDGGSADYAVVRLEDDGDLDPTFDGDGRQNVTFGGVDMAQGLAFSGLGRLVVTGFTNTGPNPNNFGVVQLLSDGTLDTSFSDDGMQRVDFGANEQASAVAVRLNRVAVAGASGTAPNRNFAVAMFGDSVATASAQDPPATPEGNSGTTNAPVTIRLAQASAIGAQVGYASADGTATAGSDYDAVAGTLTFAPGQVERTVNVPVRGDSVVEPNETLLLNLTASGTALVGTAQATVTIANDDAATGPEPKPRAALVGRLRMRPRAFRAAKRGASLIRVKAKGGSVVSYRLSASGTVRFTIARRVVSRRCRGKHTSVAANRTCRVFKRVRGSLTHAGAAGTNKLRFTGRLARRTLAAGTYRLTATAPNRSKRMVTFRIIG
jgi:uncharacterized delta-60 repeat protein